MVTRRQVIGGLLGGAVAAVGGGALFAFTRTPHAALAPWQSPGLDTDDPRLAALEWAVLAPNPHNRQPWLADLSQTDAVTLYCDLDRRLPETDPYDRQITIGLGCFTELFAMAAASKGFLTDVTLFPDGEPAETARLDQRPIAHLALSAGGASADPLFAAAPNRRSTKEPFDDRPIDAETLERLAPAVTRQTLLHVTAPDEVATINDLAWQAHSVETATPRTMQESVDLMRFTKAEVNANPDGIDLGGNAMMDALHHAGLVTPDTLMDPQSTAFAQGMSAYRALFDSTKGWVALVSEGNTRADQIAAGRDWLRLNLAATAAGVALHPISQALQEFPEMAGLYGQMHDALGVDPPRRVQMMGRVGYGPAVPPSPRWPARTRIV